MPISREKFDDGEKIAKRYIQENIMLILEENPEQAVSSKDLCVILEASPQTINQALRSLEYKGMIVRGLIRDDSSGQLVAHVMEVSHAQTTREQIKKDEEEDSRKAKEKGTRKRGRGKSKRGKHRP